MGKFPSTSLAMNKAWLAAALTAAILLAWLKLLALDGRLAKAEPKTVRYRIRKDHPGPVEPRPPGPSAGLQLSARPGNGPQTARPTPSAPA
jgi:hypothetical protein